MVDYNSFHPACKKEKHSLNIYTDRQIVNKSDFKVIPYGNRIQVDLSEVWIDYPWSHDTEFVSGLFHFSAYPC